MTRSRSTGTKTRFSVKRAPTGQTLVKVLRNSPLRDVNMKRRRTRSRVRNVKL